MALYPLPDLVLFEDFNGDWDKYLNAVHEIFLKTIARRLKFLDIPVSCRYFEPINEKHRTFWHLITENPEQSTLDEDRIPDIRRCERIQWIPHIITNGVSEEVLCWENKRGKNKNVVLWLRQEKYMVVLSRRAKYFLLKTAYCHGKIGEHKNFREWERSTDPRKS